MMLIAIPPTCPPTIINLDWCLSDPTVDDELQIKRNLVWMYKRMIIQSKTPADFFGNPYRAGDNITTLNGTGITEAYPHNNLHSTDLSNPIDMGALYSASRDPIVFAHHANVDRTWNLWLGLGGTNFTDSDWLNSTFIFYNEEAKPVRMRIGDCLDTKKLGYTYQNMPIAWLDKKPTARAKAKTLPSAPEPGQVFPTNIDKATNVIVKRPKKSGSGSAEEILVIEGVEYDKGNYLKLNGYINEDDVNSSSPEYSEYLGSFSNVPHSQSMIVKTNVRFRISEVLNDLKANNYENVLVTLVPKSSPITINGAKIPFESSE